MGKNLLIILLEKSCSLLKNLEVSYDLKKKSYDTMSKKKNLNFLHIIKSRETLDEILRLSREKIKFVYARFGDGDLQLAHRKNSGTHLYCKEIGEELKESFQIDHPHYLRSLPLDIKKYGGDEPNMFKNYTIEIYCDEVFNRAKKIVGDKIYSMPIYSAIALMYQATYHPEYVAYFPDELTKVGERVLLIGNEENSFEDLNMIFNNRISAFIKTPNLNAYTQIEKVWDEVQEYINQHLTEYVVIVGFLGNSGRVLAKRLWEKYDRFLYFDFSSLMDVLIGGGGRHRGWQRSINKMKVRESLLRLIKERQE